MMLADEEGEGQQPQPREDGGVAAANRIAELEQQLKRAAEIGRNLLLQNEQQKNEKNELAGQLLALQEEHRALETRYEKTKETYTETEFQNTELEKHVDLLQSQVAEQRAELGKMEALREEHKVLRIEYEACKLKLNQAEESFRKSLIEKKREAKIATTELVENASGLQREVQDRDREIGQLRTRLQNMDALESQNQQLLAANETIPKLEADKEKLSKAVKNIVKVNRRLQTQLDEYQRLYAQAQGVIASLQEARPDGEQASDALDQSLADELELAMNESPIRRQPSPRPSQEESSFEATAQLLFEAEQQTAFSAAASSSSSSSSSSVAVDKDAEVLLLEQVMEWRGLLNDSRSTLTSPMMNKHLTLPDLLHTSTELLKVVQEEVKERLALEGEKKLVGQSREIVCQVLELLLQNSELRLEGNRFKLKTFNRVHEKPVPSAGAAEPPPRPAQAQPSSFLSFLGFNR